MRVAWVWLLAIGCGDNIPDADDGARSGSRLRLRWFDIEGTRQWQAEAGTRIMAGRLVETETYYDRDRDETCIPQPWLDGTTRCTPDVELIASKRYLDAQCTIRVTERPQDYRYVGDYDDKCGLRRRWRVYPVIRTMPRNDLYYVAADGRCWGVPSTASEVGVLGDELAAGAFAEMTLARRPDGERVAVRYREAGDGLRLPLGLDDAVLGASVLVHTDSGERVMPPGWNTTNPLTLFYADAACAGRAYVRVDPGCPAPKSALEPGPIFYAIGARSAETPLFTTSAGVCKQLLNPIESDFYEVLTAAPIVPVGMSVDTTAEQRRVELQHARARGVSLRLRALFDTQLGTECVPQLFPDDVYRCMPASGITADGFFEDAACQQGLRLVQIPAQRRPARHVVVDRELFGGTLTIYEAVDPYVGPLFARGGFMGHECLAVDVVEPLHRRGRVVEWSELATATLVTD
jgi:hypothetical protein